MPHANANKMINEGFMDLADQWTNNLQVTSQIDEVPSGEYDPSVVLCTLEGILSDFGEMTRNRRWYTQELWENIINSPDFEELKNTRTLFGESDHPMDIEDRCDVHYNYVSHCVRDVWIDYDNNCVKGKIDILDTPAGRIIFTFVKYGSTLGVSSRGAGDLLAVDSDGNKFKIEIDEETGKYVKTDPYGNKVPVGMNDKVIVDPDNYQFFAWDIVHRPSNRRARVNKISESINANKRLSNLVESAKSDKKSLTWIKSLVESTDVKDKSEIITKIDEYTDMLNGDDSDECDCHQKDELIKSLQQDIINLTNTVVDLMSKMPDKKVKQSNLDDDTTHYLKILDNIDELPNKLTESINKSSSKTDDIVDEICEKVLDRIDEAYEHLIKPITLLNKKVAPFGDLIKANGEFVVGAVEKLIPEIPQPVDNSAEVEELKETLDDANDEISNLKDANQRLNERIKTLLGSKLTDSHRYLTLRCNQLGINENSAIRRLGNDLSEYSFDDIDDILNEMYRRPSSQRINESVRTQPIGHGSIVKNDNKINESTSDSLLELIKNNM